MHPKTKYAKYLIFKLKEYSTSYTYLRALIKFSKRVIILNSLVSNAGLIYEYYTNKGYKVRLISLPEKNLLIVTLND